MWANRPMSDERRRQGSKDPRWNESKRSPVQLNAHKLAFQFQRSDPWPKQKKSKTKKSKVKKTKKAKRRVAATTRGKTRKSKARKAKKAVRKAAKPKAKVARKTAPKKKKQIIGEGDYEGSRRFLKDESEFVKRHSAEIPAMGKEAETALAGPEGDALRAAEKEAESRSKAQGE